MLIQKIKKLCLILFSPKLFYQLIKYGVAASTENFKALKTISECETVFDIGANRGQFSIAVKYFYPKSNIVAFEPLLEPFDKFNQIFKNDSQVSVFNCAIGLENKDTIIHESKRDDSSSLLPITNNQSKIFPGTEEVGTTDIKMKRIDTFIKDIDLQRPALMKIDVQGFELEVLKSCKEYLSLFDYIYIECSFIELYKGQALTDEIIKFLDNYSFGFYSIYNIHYNKNGSMVQADFLFKNNQII